MRLTARSAMGSIVTSLLATDKPSTSCWLLIKSRNRQINHIKANAMHCPSHLPEPPQNHDLLFSADVPVAPAPAPEPEPGTGTGIDPMLPDLVTFGTTRLAKLPDQDELEEDPFSNPALAIISSSPINAAVDRAPPRNGFAMRPEPCKKPPCCATVRSISKASTAS